MAKKIVKICSAVVAFVLVFLFVQQLLVPKYASGIPGPEGLLTREYYFSNFDHDILFIGDCEVFHTFSPITLWEEFGITSFIRGNAQQLLWQSYYLLADALRFERPRVIVLNVLAMQYGEPQYEPYNRLTLDGMRWSRYKVRAIRASMTEDESFWTYVFPFFRYKDRWQEIRAEDFQYFFRHPRGSVNGFMIQAYTRPADWVPYPLPRADYRFGEKAYYYLEKITALAAAHDIPLVLVKAPSLFPYWPRQWNEQIVEFANENDLMFINLLEYIDDIGLDYSKHTFDGGATLNVFGAEKVAYFFGHRMRDAFALPDRRGEPDTAAHWGELSELYHRNIQRQLREIEETGQMPDMWIR